MLDQPVPNPLAKNPNFYTHKVVAAVGLILIGIIIIGAGIWYFVQSAQDKAGTADNTTVTKIATSSAKTATSSTQKTAVFTYKPISGSTFKQFSFEYPNNLTVTNIFDIDYMNAPGRALLTVSQRKLTSVNDYDSLIHCVKFWENQGSNFQSAQVTLDNSFGGTFHSDKVTKVNSTVSVKINNQVAIERNVIQSGETENTLEAAVTLDNSVKNGEVSLYLRSCSSADNSTFEGILASLKF